jgi:fluoride exporter
MLMILAVALGGALGSVLRYAFGRLAVEWLGAGFPYGTLGVNALGCLLAGGCYVMLVERGAANEWRGLVLVGVLGGFTTFSAFSVETLKLWESSGAGIAGANVALNVVLSVAGAAAGFWIARQWL